ncbi:tetratricopeptide repeat protein [Streptomyces sp. NBC_01750]|uniref:tetratricopeptide repeat protein n=1 Tax=Streptomyces sp. NBC_01750 TaxID=2975928 RepID=UPI002DDABA3C|nr:tetratricopeptide repeat protein [Streptomyces sp. NBC_01750]WSD33150.1 tetratricopeptide repeat protein [Streptomyces sp. NBC_01750]
MKSETVKNASVSMLVGATLVTGVIMLAPGWGEDGPPPAPGPAARAMAAVGAGAPPSVSDLDALIRDREKWLGAHPGDGESWAMLGSAYVERGTQLADPAYYSRAESALRHSLEVVPDDKGNVDALVGLAALANARRDFGAARTWGERAKKQKPERWTVYPVLIDAYNGLGDYPAAGKAMDKLEKLHSGGQTLGLASQIFRERGWREDAASLAYSAAAGADAPAEKAAALQRLGELAWERGEPQEALDNYDASLRFVSKHHPSLVGRARALVALGRTREAIRDYRTALQLASLPEYALETGELYQSLELEADAATQYEQLRVRAAKAEEDGVNEQLVLGRFEADHGDPESAVERLTGEWVRQHRSVHVADALGWALYQAGRAEEALPYARKATGQGLRSALFAYHRGEIERALGQPGAARRHLAEALRINPYFSPLLAPVAKEALDELGEPPPGGPKDVTGEEEAAGEAEQPSPGQSPSEQSPPEQPAAEQSPSEQPSPEQPAAEQPREDSAQEKSQEPKLPPSANPAPGKPSAEAGTDRPASPDASGPGLD